MSGVLQMMLGGRTAPSVLVHNTGEGGSEGAYTTDGSENRTISFNTSGQFQANSGPGNASYAWLLAGSSSQVDIFFHQTGGDTFNVGSSALDTWLNLGTTRGMILDWPGGVGTSTATVQVSMRDAVTLITLVSAVTIQMSTHP